MNLSSSRSHAIFTLHFEKININTINNYSDSNISVYEKNLPISFKINFIDLAGSERLKKTGATGERFKESISINSGLLALSKVIMSLSENNPKTYISYRDSKLTRMLKDSLNGNSITLIIACISTLEDNYEETLNTLNYASFAKSIKISPLINLNFNGINFNSNKEKYEEIINKLKTQNFELIKKIENNKIKNENNQLDIGKSGKEKDLEIQRLKNFIKMMKNKMIVFNLYLYLFKFIYLF
jgi:kinesin family protein 4/21/27